MKSQNFKMIKDQRFLSHTIVFELLKYQWSIKWTALKPGIRFLVVDISDNNCSVDIFIRLRRPFRISIKGGLVPFPGEVPLVFNHGKKRFSESGQPPPSESFQYFS